MIKDYILENGDFSEKDLNFKESLKSDLITRIKLRKCSKKTGKKNILKLDNSVVSIKK